MGDEGPTTVGSIVGKLKMDRDQWMADKAATLADARELRELDPTVTVHANVGEALGQLEALKAAQEATGGVVSGPTVSASPSSSAGTDAVASAQARLTAAENASEAATNRAILAQMRLSEVEKKVGSDSYTLAAAQEAARLAIERSETAATKAVVAEDALTAAQQAAARAALEDAAAQDEQAKSTDNAGQSMSRIQAIFTAVVALGPGLIPIAGWAVGAGGALTAMLGVGVLAILGIKNELKDGSAEADQFASNLGLLKGDLSTLEATASSGVLAGFQSVVAQIDADMPTLNAETETYSRLLGSVASTSVEGLLGGWKQLSPLVADVASYLVAVDERLASFAMSPQFAQFVSYATANLPRVENLLDSLTTTAFHVLAAFAPWGGVVVDVITDVSNIIEAIPTPVLSTLIELALGGSLAFKAWTSIPTMLMSVATTLKMVETVEGEATVATGALGAAIDFMEGPIGWVIAGLGAMAAIVAVAASAQNNAKQAATDYASAVALDNGVIGDNITLMAAKKLQDEGAISDANQLGIKTDELVKAATGNQAAIEKVNDALYEQTGYIAGLSDSQNSWINESGKTTDAQAKQLQAAQNLSHAMEDNAKAVTAAIKSYNDLQTALGGTTITTQAQLQAQVDLANEYGTSVSVYEAAVVSQKKTADQAKATTVELQLENDAATLLTNAFTLMNGGTLSLASAQTGLAAANNSTVDSLKKNKTVIDGNSAAAVANQQAIQGSVQAAQAEAEAVGKATGSSKDAAAAYEASKTALEHQLAAQHLLTPALQQYIDKLYDVKDLKIPPTKLDIDTAAAAAKLLALQKQISSILNSGILTSASAKNQAIQNAKTMSLLTVPGHAGGGTVTGIGSGTSDSNLVALSVGEEVVRASSASKWRPMIQAMNSGSPSQVSSTAAAMGIGGGAPSTTSPVHVQVVNKSGTPIDDLIELHIQQHGMWQQIHLDSGGHN